MPPLVTPFDQAQAVYEREPCARTFFEDLHFHLCHGYVYSSPGCFAMVREVNHDWSEQRMLAPWETQPGGDCWMIWLLAGNAAEAIGKLPHPKPWLATERSGRLRVVAAERFLARLGWLSQ
ncbi:MAG: hypothetical protein JWO08_1189 [Verrucomicrobiaceae bacterium]|nr:hypothetical protein [Verrucomicrobiaceae bacterium]